jgi:HEAT repeat protein
MADGELKVREAAARVAATEAIGARSIVAALNKAAPEDQVRLLGALAQRQERAAASTVVALLKSPEPAVQQAAAQALVEVGGPDQVAALVELLGPTETSAMSASALANMRAAGTSRKIAEVAAAAEPQLRARLVGIVGSRGGSDALPELSTYVSDADAGVRKEAWKALRETARPEVAVAYLALLPKAAEADRDAASQAVNAAMKQMPAGARSEALVKAWNNSDASTRAIIANVMAAFPDPGIAPSLMSAMDDTNPAVQEAAVRALADWPDATPMESLAAKAFSLPTESLRTVALRGAVRQMAQAPGVDPKARLLDLFRKTRDEAGRKAVCNALVERLGVDAFGALESLFADAQVGATARGAYVSLYEKAKDMTTSELDPDEWKAKASHGAGEVKLAFDGKKNTRWATGTEQTPGMWFSVDLGRTAALTSIELDYEASPSDGPKGYKAFTSMDGKSWVGPVAEGAGPDRRLTIKFANSPIARWIKLEQTSSKAGLFWSIHEMRVRSGMDPVRFAAVAKKAQELKAAK